MARDPSATLTDNLPAPQYTTRARRYRGTEDQITQADGLPRFTRSEGQRKLLDVDGTQMQIATAIGATRQSIVDWRKGARQPAPGAQQRMWEVFGIPVDDWRQPWKNPARVSARAAPPDPPPPADTPPPDAPPAAAVSGNTVEGCQSLLRVIANERAQPNLLPSEKVKLVDSEAKLLKLLADLTTRAELAEDRYVREHPAWQRVRNAIAEALKPHPAAAAAVAEALDRLGMGL